ncbi:MAG: PilT/PilU family type 4a pilus ATPase [Humidesulfovibrio sp.]|uniref:type IV pilus twitching motility protein PilT n=1 Tax=Humidesulfovibrio sp. TaxID=2910988 RepID=UPI002733592A|nr:PilT/PilU family type 4a pilus ATPase [Humidesulfovibrio sp.]MDP2846633.1 PilT/PilU family type 4a pilus ATPase [Humidesulfovibrio sp.]
MNMTRQQFDGLMAQVLEQHPDVADVIITTGKAIQAEVHGELKDAITTPDLGKLSALLTKAMALALIGENARLQKALAGKGSCDLSYALPGKGRFRVNIFSQRGSLALVMRRLPSRIPTMEELSLPQAFQDMAPEKNGLILVTGGTGSGKSNSLAALIDRINETRAGHIVTLEDPVEFTHPHKKGTVNQRELGIDFDTFASGLRAAFRQGPKVILVGEIRDPETMEIALQAAGTGHLVLSTLHTTDAGATINRILGLFSPSEERLIRMRLAESLRFVVSQRLLPKEGGGRVAAFEVLKNTMRVKDLILQGETGDKTFYGVLESSATYGMQTFDQHFLRLYEAGHITEETALLSASDRSRLGQMIDRTKALRGDQSTGLILEGLEDDAGTK